MTGTVAPLPDSTRGVSLAAIQAPVRARLDRVIPMMHHVVSHDLPMIEQVSARARTVDAIAY